MDILQANRFALDQLALLNTNVNYFPDRGLVTFQSNGLGLASDVDSRWHTNNHKPSTDFFVKSGWHEFLMNNPQQELVVPSNIGAGNQLAYPVYYNGQPFLCFIFDKIPLVDPNDYQSRFIPENVQLITENSICRLVKFGKYQTVDDYVNELKMRGNEQEINSFITDYAELIASLAVVKLIDSPIHVIDGKLYTFLDSLTFNKLGTASIVYLQLRKLADIFKDNDKISEYLDILENQGHGAFGTSIVRVKPEFKVPNVTPQQVPIDFLTKQLVELKLTPGYIDMLMCVLSLDGPRKEYMDKPDPDNLIRIYYHNFNHLRVGITTGPTGRPVNIEITLFLKKHPEKLYSYQDGFNENLTRKYGRTMYNSVQIPPIKERFTILVRSYNILKPKSREAAMRSLISSRWTNYTPIYPEKTLNSLIVNSREYSPHLFYNTPLYNVISLSEGPYDIRGFSYLTKEDHELIDAWMRGIIMPMAYYAGLSERGFEVLSGPGAFLDLYENLEVRKTIDRSFVLWESPLKYLVAGELSKVELPGVGELMGMLER